MANNFKNIKVLITRKLQEKKEKKLEENFSVISNKNEASNSCSSFCKSNLFRNNL